MIDIYDVMNVLAAQRSAYHSEADFQHAFAWEVHRRLPMASVRLEKPILANGQTLHLDFLIQTVECKVAVELKYKTRKLLVEVDGEEFRLADHGAQDFGRYDFIKDICRLEGIAANLQNCEGWAILLTNDSMYWRPSTNERTNDAAFRLSQDRTLYGTLGWGANASDGTKRNREANLSVDGKYTLQWTDYAAPSSGNYGQFRFLAVHVPKRV
ncbi:hypothetical protein ACFPTO_18560 [Paraburkholderia denitrificans]|uniref:Uncharacterized protein n=1 Tax=Paraburkholderia denitrificans TaxID=694025 RepID=A0ABW0JCN3_9BURK